MRACTELGVTGVSLYPGTKHSTVTARGGILTPEEIKRGGTGHQTNAAFERYLLPDMRDKIKISAGFPSDPRRTTIAQPKPTCANLKPTEILI
jgi:hypothetical protein